MTNYDAWNLTLDADFGNSTFEQRVEFICELGVLAPSVHNTQPWRFSLSGHSLNVSFDAERLLRAGDPTHREGWISLGSMAQHLIVGAAFCGLDITQFKRHESGIVLDLKLCDPDPSLKAMAIAMTHRFSDRSSYLSKSVKSAAINELAGIAFKGVQVIISTDPQVINAIAGLTRRALTIALGTPAFREELSGLIRPSWTSAPTGMPGFTLGVSRVRSALEARLVASGIMAGSQARKEERTMMASPAVVLVLTEADAAAAWLDAGRAYEQAALIATKHGLHTATSAAVVEAADFHRDIEDLIGSGLRLQTVMRIGYSSAPIAHSPRYTPSEITSAS